MLFSPGCPGYTRRPIPYEYGADWSGIKLHPKEFQQPFHAAVQTDTGIGAIAPIKIPGPLNVDIPMAGAFERLASKKNQPAPPDEHHSNSRHYNKDLTLTDNDYTFFEAPFFTYGSWFYKLPEYFTVDFTNVADINCIGPIGIENSNEPISTYSLPPFLQKKFLLRRNDGYNIKEWDSINFRSPVASPFPYNPEMAISQAWRLIYNITDGKSAEYLTYGSNISISLFYRQFYTIGPIGGTPLNLKLASPTWHIMIHTPRIDPGTLPYAEYPWIFTPLSGYYWNKGATDRADQWYTDEAGTLPGEGYIRSQSGETGRCATEFANDLLDQRYTFLDGVLNSGTFPNAHNGTIRLDGPTEFTLTQVQTVESTFGPYVGYRSMADAPIVILEPTYL